MGLYALEIFDGFEQRGVQHFDVHDIGRFPGHQPFAGIVIQIAADVKRIAALGVRIGAGADDGVEVGDGLREQAIVKLVQPVGMCRQECLPLAFDGG